MYHLHCSPRYVSSLVKKGWVYITKIGEKFIPFWPSHKQRMAEIGRDEQNIKKESKKERGQEIKTSDSRPFLPSLLTRAKQPRRTARAMKSSVDVVIVRKTLVFQNRELLASYGTRQWNFLKILSIREKKKWPTNLRNLG